MLDCQQNKSKSELHSWMSIGVGGVAMSDLDGAIMRGRAAVYDTQSNLIIISISATSSQFA